MNIRYSVFLLVMLGFVLTALGQTEPATAPTTTRERYVRIIPPGFVTLDIDGQEVICELADEAVIRKAFEVTKPATRPATMPVDLLQNLKANRDKLIAGLTKDLGLPDTGPAEKWYDEKLLPEVQKFAAIKPPISILYSTKPRIMELLKAGWTDPHFYYNRAANDLSVDLNIEVTTVGAADDIIIPAMYEPGTTAEARVEKLAGHLMTYHAMVDSMLANYGLILLQSGLMSATTDLGLKSIAFKREQAWFGAGTEAVLGVKYATMISGEDRPTIMRIGMMESPRSPVHGKSIDLLHPANPDDLRRDYAGPYTQAMMKKSAKAVWKLSQSAGDEAIGKVLIKLREKIPADGEQLIELIKAETGVDLMSDVTK